MTYNGLCECVASAGAILLMILSNAHGAEIMLGGGWQADVAHPEAVSIVVDLVGPDFLAIQVSKDFTDPPGVGGLFPSELILFQQIADDSVTVPRIVIVDESITNLTGVHWTDYHWALFDGTDAWFNVPLSLDWSTHPFANKAFSDPWNLFNDPDKATNLLADEGVVWHNSSFFPGAAPGDGELIIDVDLSVVDPVSFTFKQFPTPEPAAVALMVVAGVPALCRRRRRRR